MLSDDIRDNLTLNVLTSNIFQCKEAGSIQNDIPTKDEYSNSYSCGSSDLEISLTVWTVFIGGVIVFLVFLLLLFLQSWTDKPVSTTVNVIWRLIECIRESLNRLKKSCKRMFYVSIYWWRIAEALLSVAEYPKTKRNVKPPRPSKVNDTSKETSPGKSIAMVDQIS